MIIVEGIRKKYKKYVLDDISFSVKKGQCVGILGANGCGKSTLLSIMAGTKKAMVEGFFMIVWILLRIEVYLHIILDMYHKEIL